MITAAEVRKLFLYDPQEGILRWKQGGTGRRWDLVAGSIQGQGYRSVGIGGGKNKRYYQVHRIIWLLRKGRWPREDLDHIDGNRLNNRWDNLREATRSQNKANVGPSRKNSTGYKGVFRSGRTYRASICVNYRQMHLGCFDTAEQAHAAYSSAAKKYFGSYARVK